MLKYNLSNRMASVAHLVPKGTTACDIGCDHGFVAIYLVENGKCPKVIAMDINRGPLLRAKEHIGKAGLSAYIETRLSDGLEKLKPGEADCMIAAGMGGRLTVKILSDYPEKLKSLRCLILQPQSEVAFVRRFLRENGYEIRKEDMVLEDGKFYPVMRAEAVSEESAYHVKETKNEESASGADNRRDDRGGDMPAEQRIYTESLEDEFGPCLLRDRHPVLLQYLDRWEKQQNKIFEQVVRYPERRAQVEEELARIRDARGLYDLHNEKIR